jgi:sugar O-acyltransferase (sialic acid O-acetyltransferase NeuD family)
VKEKNLVIFGLGELAHIAYEYFSHDSNYKVVAFSVDDEYYSKSNFLNIPVVKFSEIADLYPVSTFDIFIAVGASRMNQDRARLFTRFQNLGYTMASYVSSKSFVWHNVIVGQNVFVFEDNTLQPFTQVEDNCILWSGNHIGHRTIIRANTFISSHCVVSGYCEIGENSYLGVNCTINDKVRIAESTLIGSGSVITKDTQPGLIYVGNPARAVPGKKSSEIVFS